MAVLDNSWDFSKKLGIKCHLPLFGHYFRNKCPSKSCCCIGSTFGVPISTVDSTKKTASKKIREVTQTFLLFGWKKLLVKVYHHHHQPVDHQSLTFLINLSLLFHSCSLCICKWRGSYSEGMPSLPSSLIPLFVFSVPNPRMSYCGIPLRPELPRIAYERLRIRPNRLRFSYDV